MDKTNKSLHLKGLNGLRAIAALSVLIAHISLPGLADFGLPKRLELPLAGFGVTLFFVISGFLITYLMLLEREKIGKIAIKKFYFRRILRIWPIYYLVIIISILVLLAVGQSKEIFNYRLLYYLFFAANIPFILNVGIQLIVHLWSIGVEEQFYLFWPLIIRFSKKKLFLIVFILILTIVFVKICFWAYIGSSSYAYRTIQITRFHCMLIGALGAIYFFNSNKLFLGFLCNNYMQIISWILFFLLGFGSIYIPAVIAHEFVAILSVILIVGQVCNSHKRIHLEYPIFDFIGKISYGIYILHPIVIFILSIIFKRLDMNIGLKYLLVYFSVFMSTMLLSWISYNYFESLFLKLKNKFTIIKSSNSMFNF